MEKIFLNHSFDSIISLENLLDAWKEFVCGKRKKLDVQEFGLYLMQNISSLHTDLKNNTYCHGPYSHFRISDPKPRDIHKSSVRDRLLHHAIYRILYPYFDQRFIFDSYSCRVGKGTHRAINRFRDFGRKVSKNNTKTCWVLKCDIKKFFASIGHEILKNILVKHISDQPTLSLLGNIIDSFSSCGGQSSANIKVLNSAMAEFSTLGRKGLPLGNLTSQLLVNVYMNEFDQYMKHILKVKYYIRYADDFVILSENKQYLEKILKQVEIFLGAKLNLSLHPDKVFIKTLASGVDFLGWVNFSSHRILRTATKKRMVARLDVSNKKETLDSYLGMLSHGAGHRFGEKIKNEFYAKLKP